MLERGSRRLSPEYGPIIKKARRAIRSAKLVLAYGDYESAVSHAYYAMFYLAEGLLLLAQRPWLIMVFGWHVL
jgi:uncharacterized protein (UPF0332 family)